MDSVPCEWCGEQTVKKPHTRKDSHIFCSTKCGHDFHNAQDRKERLLIWESAPPKICLECGKIFKPAFQSGWPKRKRCPECMLTPGEHNRRRRAEEKKGGPKHTKRPWHVNGLDLGKQWKCRGCGKMSSNRLDCPECKARILAIEDSWLDDYSIETIRLSDMGLMPY